MSLSRSDSRRKERHSRKQKQRRTISLLLILTGGAVVLFGTWLILTSGEGFGGKDGRADDPEPPNVVADGSKGNGEDTDKDNTEDAGNAGGESEAPDETGSEPAPEPDSGAIDGGMIGEDEAITMSFVGDLLPGEYLTPLMEQNGFDYPYRNALLYLSEPDITAGNLELPITLGGTPIEGTPYVYKGHPDVLPAIKEAGFDVLSLANNHAMDQGLEGMTDTIRYLKETGFGYMGTGNNDKEAFEPYYTEAKGVKVAFVGLSRVIPYAELKADRNTPGIAETYDTTRAVAAIKKAEENADLVVVMVHWGDDGTDRPVEYQTVNARAYIDAGADLVIGAHPHVLQGFEVYKGKWIAYSLGNFIFSAYPKGNWAETGVLDAACTKDGNCKLKFNPMIVVQGQPTPIEGDAAAAMLERLSSVSYGARIEADGTLVEQ